MNPSSILFKIKDVSTKHGFGHVVRVGVFVIFSLIKYKVFRRWKTFSFQNKKYNYFIAFYNNTWINERIVEIPIAMDFINKFYGKRILEVGNVLSHYYPFEHDVVDKYDTASGIINEDILDFKSTEKYDLIVSISTMEHVGWDETPKDELKVIRALENMKKLVKPQGIILITMPLGYNPPLDGLLKNGTVKFDEQYYMIKLNKNNEWRETSWSEVQGIKIGDPSSPAMVLVIGIIHGKE